MKSGKREGIICVLEGEACGHGTLSGCFRVETYWMVYEASSSFSIFTLQKVQWVLEKRQIKNQPNKNPTHTPKEVPSIWVWFSHTPNTQQRVATQMKWRNLEDLESTRLQLLPQYQETYSLPNAGTCPAQSRQGRHFLPYSQPGIPSGVRKLLLANMMCSQKS